MNIHLSYGLGELPFSWCLALIVAVHPHHEVVLLMEDLQDHEEAMQLSVIFFQRPGIPGKRPVLTVRYPQAPLAGRWHSLAFLKLTEERNKPKTFRPS